MRAIGKALLGFIASVSLLACAHAPTQPGERADLVREARHTLAQMETQDPSLGPLLDSAVGYVVFPVVGSGGFLVGGGGGKGVLFENGVPVGFATIEKLQAGALAGGERYAQVVVIRDRETLRSMKEGHYALGAQASATLVRSGAASHATWDKGTAVFIEPTRGAIINASVGGQRIRLTM